MSEKQKQMLVELATTLAVIILYWITMQPDWKLQMYGEAVMVKLRTFRRVNHVGLSLEHQAILRKFRQEISEWEHRNASEG